MNGRHGSVTIDFVTVDNEGALWSHLDAIEQYAAENGDGRKYLITRVVKTMEPSFEEEAE